MLFCLYRPSYEPKTAGNRPDAIFLPLGFILGQNLNFDFGVKMCRVKVFRGQSVWGQSVPGSKCSGVKVCGVKVFRGQTVPGQKCSGSKCAGSKMFRVKVCGVKNVRGQSERGLSVPGSKCSWGQSVCEPLCDI